nr:30S ribosomal protein S20 [Candidatus Levybacteria bacterium]
MPVIKSAKKKLRQDKKREKVNKVLRTAFRDAVKDAQKSKTPKDILKAIVLTDKAVKKKLIHKNKAARIKSNLSKLTNAKIQKTKVVEKPVKKTIKKTKSPKSKR